MAWEPFEEDDFWFGEGVPTFTLEEYFWATVFPNPVRVWTDKTGEAAAYFNLNMWMATISAYRKMGETLTTLRFMYMAERSPALLRGAARAAPVAGLGYVAAHAGHDVLQTSIGVTAHRAAELQAPGSSTADAGSLKPWWMPLPIYVGLYG